MALNDKLQKKLVVRDFFTHLFASVIDEPLDSEYSSNVSKKINAALDECEAWGITEDEFYEGIDKYLALSDKSFSTYDNERNRLSKRFNDLLTEEEREKVALAYTEAMMSGEKIGDGDIDNMLLICEDEFGVDAVPSAMLILKRAQEYKKLKIDTNQSVRQITELNKTIDSLSPEELKELMEKRDKYLAKKKESK